MEFTNIITQYLTPVVLIICLVIGYIIKNCLPQIPNNYIPLIVAIIGVIFSAWVEKSINPNVIATGLCSGLASTGMHQLLTRTLENFGGEIANDNSDK